VAVDGCAEITTRSARTATRPTCGDGASPSPRHGPATLRRLYRGDRRRPINVVVSHIAAGRRPLTPRELATQAEAAASVLDGDLGDSVIYWGGGERGRSFNDAVLPGLREMSEVLRVRLVWLDTRRAVAALRGLREYRRAQRRGK
jgi:hypothetical protein